MLHAFDEEFALSIALIEEELGVTIVNMSKSGSESVPIAHWYFSIDGWAKREPDLVAG